MSLTKPHRVRRWEALGIVDDSVLLRGRPWRRKTCWSQRSRWHRATIDAVDALGSMVDLDRATATTLHRRSCSSGRGRSGWPGPHWSACRLGLRGGARGPDPCRPRTRRAAPLLEHRRPRRRARRHLTLLARVVYVQMGRRPRVILLVAVGLIGASLVTSALDRFDHWLSGRVRSGSQTCSSSRRRASSWRDGRSSCWPCGTGRLRGTARAGLPAVPEGQPCRTRTTRSGGQRVLVCGSLTRSSRWLAGSLRSGGPVGYWPVAGMQRRMRGVHCWRQRWRLCCSWRRRACWRWVRRRREIRARLPSQTRRSAKPVLPDLDAEAAEQRPRPGARQEARDPLQHGDRERR